MDKSEFEYLYRKLEEEINISHAKRENIQSGLKILTSELDRIDTRLDELGKEIIYVLNQLRQF